MAKRFLFLLFPILLLVSCEKQQVSHYRYLNTAVTRVDFTNKSVFYYGYCDFNKVLCDDTKSFSVSYNFRGGVDLYMVFNKNDKRIGIIDHGLGSTTYSDTLLFYKMEITNSNYREEINKMFQNSNVGIIRISNNPELEKEWYNEKETRVTYE